LEEQPKAVNIALLDGGGMGVTMCEDIGEYKVSERAAPKDDIDTEADPWCALQVLPRTSEVKKRKKEKSAIRKQGFSDETTTEEEGDSEEEQRETEDEKQETLFAEGELLKSPAATKCYVH